MHTRRALQVQLPEAQTKGVDCWRAALCFLCPATNDAARFSLLRGRRRVLPEIFIWYA
jgi:hypothetical protein